MHYHKKTCQLAVFISVYNIEISNVMEKVKNDSQNSTLSDFVKELIQKINLCFL